MQKYFDILSNFELEGTVRSADPYGNGHINQTFVVVSEIDKGSAVRYILQALNKNVFADSAGLMGNIAKVTDFLKANVTDARGVMHVIHTKDGGYYHIDEEGTCWRVYDFVEDSICLEHPESTSDFYECAYAFGNFQRQLNDFPADTLVETIPDFHNTPKRYRDFLKAVEEDVCGRAKDVKEEIEFIKSEADFYPVLFENHKAGKLPLRVTHNDTKSNNVMLDAKTKTALCVIDLDTIMPGFSVTDFGDAIRFGANTAAEDEKDVSKVSLDMDMFDMYTKGFLAGCGGLLGEDEIMLLPEGAKMMTIECGMRFLTDYLQGDTYFRTAYSGHNLVRTRTQLELVRDMNRHWDEMKAIVKKYI